MKAENIQDIYELSPLQQGILFHSLYAPESAVYFVQLGYALHGNLNVEAFEQAWQEVATRHAALRTAFYWENLEKPIQVVYRQVQVPLQQQDWRGIDPAEQQQRLQAFLLADRQQGFDLSQQCLMRLTLLRFTEESYYFVWSKHHLILDGWSTALVLKEVVELYQALCQGEMPSAPSTFYGEYIGWLQQQDLSKAEVFWRQMLKGVKAPTPLGNLEVDNLSSLTEGYDEQRIHLSEITTATLQLWARQHQLTLNTLVQGAWALLLSRYSGEEDVIYGVTVSGRPTDLAAAESIVGMFINTLPVRVQLDAEEFLLNWLKRLQVQLVEVRQYEYSPLVEVQGWSEMPRGLPLFESILVFENYPVDRVLKDWQGLEIQNVSAFDQTNYPLTVTAIPGSELEIAIAYNRRRFAPATITRILGHFQTVLEGMVTHLDVRLKDLPLLTPAERHQLLIEFNQNQSKIQNPKSKIEQCIHQLFEAQVEQSPDAVAVILEDQSLTYKELNQQANKIAHYLQKLGVQPDVLVGICVERSLEMVIAVLGVLKAGGAYVPLDPAQPLQRLAFMLQDADCKVLLTQKRLLEELPTHTGKVVCLDADWEIISQEQGSNLTSPVQPENLAYVIYTSGSTGQAKGVMVKHSSLVNTYFAWEQAYQLRQQANCHLQMANFSFDVFSGDLIRALCSGGKLVLCPRDFLLDPQQLYELMLQQKIDCAEFVPVVLRNLIEYLEKTQQRLDFMRLVICGSDSWYGAEYQKFRDFVGVSTRLINSFGLTEATIDSSYFESATAELSAQQLVPIGRPLANTQLYILNSFLQPVPIGVPGELYVGGASLARGYYNRPQLTAERFIPNVFSHQMGARMYKTGDLARYLPDGNIEFLGRIDHQVKICGFRIELGEIEALLGQHPQVRQVVVTAPEDELGNKQLVAYVVPEEQPIALKLHELRNFLKERLPDYTLPSAFVLLEALPLTPNGKVDRRSLPAAALQKLELAEPYVAPRNAVEEVLAGIWAKTLRVERVGIHDNFFELGGHSLLATQVISRIRETFQVELPLRCIFESPSVAQLAQIVIAKEAKPGLTEKIARIQKKLEGMSVEDARKALESRKAVGA